MFEERFERLDPDVWIAGYLPHWSSRAASAATYSVGTDGLRLTIPPEQGQWCPEEHDGPLRVSAVQSGCWAGPVGSPRGQQPFKDGLVVREAQPELRGFTPLRGRIEVTCRARIGPRSMVSAWMVGMEDAPDRCGEICVMEVFGDAPTAVGCGVHAFRDPSLREDFAAPRLEGLDVAELHTYGATWTREGVAFDVDGAPTRAATVAPGYPLMLILGVFDFPDRGAPGETPPTPEFRVERVRWTAEPAAH